VTLSIIALMANIVAEDVVMKEESNLVSHNSKFFILMVESSFINLCDSSDENGPFLLDLVVPLFMNSKLAKE
jgi:hypothetical protein